MRNQNGFVNHFQDKTVLHAVLNKTTIMDTLTEQQTNQAITWIFGEPLAQPSADTIKKKRKSATVL